ncbi:hypothetical protein F0A17_17430 [Billgrantia pellis]|uniref:Uncharacterized protein n=1 Tax=Billgrantia pellis TaxID=2606936 RepID=A0A7V7FWW6_9GAMM|nr:hypothetical protein [Halomonas pellis]KAA0010254.1 hypothetical protein F0A17_17430 [Halomonas pellis]
MSDELSEFEQSIKREIDAFMKPEKASPTSREPAIGTVGPATKEKGIQEKGGKGKGVARESAKAYRTGHLVRLAVRTKQLETDTVFEHRSTSISKLEAQLEAEKAAKQAGYPIVGYLIDIQSL